MLPWMRRPVRVALFLACAMGDELLRAEFDVGLLRTDLLIVLCLPDLSPLRNEEILAGLDRWIDGRGQVEADLFTAHPLDAAGGRAPDRRPPQEPADRAIADRALEVLDGAGRQCSIC